MSGLEKIIRQIEAEAQCQADELLRCARAEADQIRADLQAKCDQELGQIAEKSTRDIAACRSRGASAVEQQRRLALLQTNPDGAAGLGDVLDAGGVAALHGIREGEKGIAAH